MGSSLTPDARAAEIADDAKFIDEFGGKDDGAAPPARLRTPVAAPTTPKPPVTPKAEDQRENTDSTPAADDDDEDDDEESGAEGAEGGDPDAEGTQVDVPADEEVDDEPEEEVDPAKAEEAAVDKVVADLEKFGLKITLKDLPAEARPLVRRKLDNIQAAFTRIAQEQTAFRAERRELLAEQQFRTENPVAAISEMIAKNPDLIEKIQEQIDKFEDPDKKRLFEIETAQGRKSITDKLAQQESAQERVDQRSTEIETYVREACTKLGIPSDIVEEAVALEMLDERRKTPDLTEQELDTIIARKARSLQGFVRKEALTKRKQGIKERTAIRQTSTPAVRSGSGVTPAAPTGKKMPKDDNEFTEMMVGKL